jgi:CubicO group peptidase (beta-lactamase class C family)
MRRLSKSFSAWCCQWLLLLCTSLYPGSNTSKTLNIPQANLDALSRSIVTGIKSRLPIWYRQLKPAGLALAVVDDKRDLLNMEFGMISPGSDFGVNRETIFSIQSVSKSFTALAVLMAVADGILSLDAPITEYMPEFRVNSIYEKNPENKITLRHLLSHRAGFTHEAPTGSNFNPVPGPFKEHIKSISRSWLKYPVGYRIAYSNIGIDLAGYILARSTGKKFTHYIRNRIFKPLKMEFSTANIKKIKRSKNRASGLGKLKDYRDQLCPIPLQIPMIPAAGIYSSTRDMAKYTRFLINRGKGGKKRLIREKLMKLMFEVTYPRKGQMSGYTLGLVRQKVPGTYSLSHAGGGFGFHSYLLIYPELKLGLVLLMNTREADLTEKLKTLVEEILEQKLGKTQPGPGYRDKTGLSLLDHRDPGLKSILGVYDKTWTIRLLGKHLEIAPDGIQFFPLTMYKKGEAMVGRFGNYSEIQFLPRLDQKPGSMVYTHRLYDNVIFRDYHFPQGRGDKFGPDKSSWHKYIGIYIIKKWGCRPVHTFTITIQKGYLYLNWMRCREYLPGLFFTYNGEALDFRGHHPVFRNIRLHKLGPAALPVNH